MDIPGSFFWGAWPGYHGDYKREFKRQDDSYLAVEQHFLIHISALVDGDLTASSCAPSSERGRCFQQSLEGESFGKSLMEQHRSKKDRLMM